LLDSLFYEKAVPFDTQVVSSGTAIEGINDYINALSVERCTLYVVRCTLYVVRCTLCVVRYALYDERQQDPDLVKTTSLKEPERT